MRTTATVAAILATIAATAAAAEPLPYNSRTLPQYYQTIIRHHDTGTYFAPKMFVHGPREMGNRSNPNAQPPWLNPAGTDRLVGLRIERSIEVPDGKHVEVWRDIAYTNWQSGRRGRQFYRWTFPLGTSLTETLAVGDAKPFIERRRTKLTATDWDTEETIVGTVPTKYQPVKQDCQVCHREAGVDVRELRGHTFGRDWYGAARGSDTVFSWRPITPRGKIIARFRAIVRWRK